MRADHQGRCLREHQKEALSIAAWRSYERPLDNVALCPQVPTTATMTQLAEDSGHNSVSQAMECANSLWPKEVTREECRTMTAIAHFSDSAVTCYANMRMANGEPCYISIARTGISVKRSRLGILGAKLYEEKNAYHGAMTAKALAYLYPDRITPQKMANPILAPFTNSVLHCSTAGEVAVVLNTAVSEAEKRSGQPITEIVTGWENVE